MASFEPLRPSFKKMPSDTEAAPGKTAMGRASEIISGMALKDWPEEAMAYLMFTLRKHGAQGAVALMAAAHYAQAVEKLPCTDSAYKITKEGADFFANRKQLSEATSTIRQERNLAQLHL